MNFEEYDVLKIKIIKLNIHKQKITHLFVFFCLFFLELNAQNVNYAQDLYYISNNNSLILINFDELNNKTFNYYPNKLFTSHLNYHNFSLSNPNIYNQRINNLLTKKIFEDEISFNRNKNAIDGLTEFSDSIFTELQLAGGTNFGEGSLKSIGKLENFYWELYSAHQVNNKYKLPRKLNNEELQQKFLNNSNSTNSLVNAFVEYNVGQSSIGIDYIYGISNAGIPINQITENPFYVKERNHNSQYLNLKYNTTYFNGFSVKSNFKIVSNSYESYSYDDITFSSQNTDKAFINIDKHNMFGGDIGIQFPGKIADTTIISAYYQTWRQEYANTKDILQSEISYDILGIKLDSKFSPFDNLALYLGGNYKITNPLNIPDISDRILGYELYTSLNYSVNKVSIGLDLNYSNQLMTLLYKDFLFDYYLNSEKDKYLNAVFAINYKHSDYFMLSSAFKYTDYDISTNSLERRGEAYGIDIIVNSDLKYVDFLGVFSINRKLNEEVFSIYSFNILPDVYSIQIGKTYINEARWRISYSIFSFKNYEFAQNNVYRLNNAELLNISTGFKINQFIFTDVYVNNILDKYYEFVPGIIQPGLNFVMQLRFVF